MRPRGPAPACRGSVDGVTSRCPFVVVVALFGCGPRTAPAAPVERAPVAEPPPATPPTDEASASACTGAYADQRQLYVDAEVEVHPDRETTFVDLCRRLPPTLQRCASPLYQIDHTAECDRAREVASPAESHAWLRMFDVLTGDPERLGAPPDPAPAP